MSAERDEVIRKLAIVSEDEKMLAELLNFAKKRGPLATVADIVSSPLKVRDGRNH